MDDRVSREAILGAAKEIVSTYIKSAVVKEGEHTQKLAISPDEVCALFTQVYSTIEQTVPSSPRKVGLS